MCVAGRRDRPPKSGPKATKGKRRKKRRISSLKRACLAEDGAHPKARRKKSGAAPHELLPLLRHAHGILARRYLRDCWLENDMGMTERDKYAVDVDITDGYL